MASPTPSSDRKILTALGGLLVLAGLAVNPWTAAYFFSPDGHLERLTRAAIIYAEVVLVAAGGVLLLLRNRLTVKVLAVNVAVLMLLLCLVEGFLLMLVRTSPPVGRGRLLDLSREIYERERNIIQYMDACAEYDAVLGYRLRPGHCTFSNKEFTTRFDVNTQGLRDDEASLRHPEVIVLGDSFAMGWGVQQDETFAQILERRTGLSVLNAAMSSFGTARAFLRLKALNTAGLRTLIIQYSQNDFEENRAFYAHHNRLPVMSRQRYEDAVRAYHDRTRYRFGTYLLMLLRSRLYDPVVLRIAEALGGRQTYEKDEVTYFLNVLTHSRIPLHGVQIIVMEINGYGEDDGTFLDGLRAAVQTDAAVAALRLETLDVPGLQNAQHYYPLDNHLNAAGHQAVAEALLPLLAR